MFCNDHMFKIGQLAYDLFEILCEVGYDDDAEAPEL